MNKQEIREQYINILNKKNSKKEKLDYLDEIETNISFLEHLTKEHYERLDVIFELRLEILNGEHDNERN